MKRRTNPKTGQDAVGTAYQLNPIHGLRCDRGRTRRRRFGICGTEGDRLPS